MDRSSAIICLLGACLFLVFQLASFEPQYSLSILVACSVLLFLASRSFVIKAFCAVILIFYLVPGVFQKLQGISQCSLSCQEITPLIVWLFYLIVFFSAMCFGKVQLSQSDQVNEEDKGVLLGLFISVFAIYDLSILEQGLIGRDLLLEKGIKNANSMFESFAFLVKSVVSIVVMRVFLRTKNTVVGLMCLLELSMYFLTTGARSWVVLPFLALAFRLKKSSKSAQWMAGTCGFILCIYAVIWSTASRLQLDSVGEILFSAALGSTNFYIELERSIGLILTDGPVYQSQLWYTAASYIPRFLWAGKPINEVSAVVTYDAWGAYDLMGGGNVLNGFIGQFILGEGFYLGTLSMLTIVLACIQAEIFLRRRASNPWSETALVFLVAAILLNGRFFASANLILPIVCFLFVIVQRFRWVFKAG